MEESKDLFNNGEIKNHDGICFDRTKNVMTKKHRLEVRRKKDCLEKCKIKNYRTLREFF